MDGHDIAHLHSSFACSGSFVVAIIIERMDGWMLLQKMLAEWWILFLPYTHSIE